MLNTEFEIRHSEEDWCKLNWYAVNTKPRQEKIAEQNLQRLSVETFCPQLQQKKVIRRKRQVVIGPLFSGYLFVRFNVDTHYRAVNYAQGVRKVVTFGPAPATVDDALIESIRQRLQDGYVIATPPSLRRGQTVRIQEGPFEGLEAIFEQEMSDQQRVVLLLQTLSFHARVTAPLKYVVNL